MGSIPHSRHPFILWCLPRLSIYGTQECTWDQGERSDFSASQIVQSKHNRQGTFRGELTLFMRRPLKPLFLIIFQISIKCTFHYVCCVLNSKCQAEEAHWRRGNVCTSIQFCLYCWLIMFTHQYHDLRWLIIGLEQNCTKNGSAVSLVTFSIQSENISAIVVHHLKGHKW